MADEQAAYGLSRLITRPDRDLACYYVWDFASGISSTRAEELEDQFPDSLPDKPFPQFYFHDIYRFLYASRFPPCWAKESSIDKQRRGEGHVELVQPAKQAAPDLQVSSSGLGDGKVRASVALVSDFILVHFNEASAKGISAGIATLGRLGKPLVCYEDAKVGRRGVQAPELCLTNRAS